MPLGLRLIRKGRWYRLPWLLEDEFQADALSDLSTKNNLLSIWVIKDDRSNTDRVLTALAACRDEVANLDYAIFDLNALDDFNIKYQRVPGNTPDAEVNDNCHIDLLDLPAQKIIALAWRILDFKIPQRLNHQVILKYLAVGVDEGYLNRDLMKPKVLHKVDNFLNRMKPKERAAIEIEGFVKLADVRHKDMVRLFTDTGKEYDILIEDDLEGAIQLCFNKKVIVKGDFDGNYVYPNDIQPLN